MNRSSSNPGRGGVFLTGFLAGAIAAFAAGGSHPPGSVPPAEPAFVVHSFQTEDGLPYSSVSAVAQTRDGYLWLGTYNGLARFDGARFVVFDASNTPGLRSSRITCLFEDAAGTLWIGHENGELTRHLAGQFEAVQLPDEWPGDPLEQIASDETDAVWALNRAGWLVRLKDGQILDPPSPDAARSVPSLVKAADGTLWVVRMNALFRLAHGRLEPWRGVAGEETPGVLRAGASADGGLWLVLGLGQLRKWQDGRWTADVGGGPWQRSFVTSLVETRSGTVVLGTLNQGAFGVRSNRVAWALTRANGLGSDWVRSIAEDHEGSLWLGTGGGGLNRLRPRPVVMVPVSGDGVPVLAVAPGAGGGLWVGTEGDGVYRLRDGKLDRFGTESGLSNLFVWSLLEDRRGRVWAGTWGQGLFVQRGDGFVPAPGLESFTGAVLALHEGPGGALWVGTDAGLARLAGGQWTWWTRGDGVNVANVRTILEEPSGTVWFGMAGGGLGRLSDGRLTQFGRGDGLAGEFVWSLWAEPNGTLWIGTFGGGLCRWRDGRFATVSTRHGLPHNVICHIAADHRGALWLSSYGGIFQVNREELNACADGRRPSVNCFGYGREDGLATLECTGGFQPAGCRSPDGRFWFPNTKGLAVVDPAGATTNSVPPPVVIEALLVEGRGATFAPAGNSRVQTGGASVLRIPPGRRRFEIQFAGLSFVAPEKVRFRYRLEGLEPDWVDGGTRRAANYSYLPPGPYTFRVTACNDDGIWNETGAALAFTVLPFFWQTRWFQAGALLAGALAVAGSVRTITRQRLRRRLEGLERQRALERERARIARDIHDDLGASLTRITLMSQSARGELDNPAQAAADLEQIYATARELTKAMDEIVWAVNPRHDTLDSLVTYLGRFAQEFAGAAGVRCRLDVPMQLPAWPLTAEVRHNLFLAFKEALHNALKHAGAGILRVSLTLAERGFTLAVEDNGRGFEPDAAGAVSPARPAAGNGLANMRRRLEEIGGACAIESAPGAGTKVRFVVTVKA